MREHQLNEDVATEPIISRVDDASGIFCSREKLFKRNFVLQKLVAVQQPHTLKYFRASGNRYMDRGNGQTSMQRNCETVPLR